MHICATKTIDNNNNNKQKNTKNTHMSGRNATRLSRFETSLTDFNIQYEE